MTLSHECLRNTCAVGLRKDKGMLEQAVSVEKPESVNREIKKCELCCRDSVVSVVERVWSA